MCCVCVTFRIMCVCVCVCDPPSIARTHTQYVIINCRTDLVGTTAYIYIMHRVDDGDNDDGKSSPRRQRYEFSTTTTTDTHLGERELPFNISVDAIIEIMMMAARKNEKDPCSVHMRHLFAAYKCVAELDLFCLADLNNDDAHGDGPPLLFPHDPVAELIRRMCDTIVTRLAEYNVTADDNKDATDYEDKYPSTTMETQIVSEIGCDVTDWVYGDAMFERAEWWPECDDNGGQWLSDHTIIDWRPPHGDDIPHEP
jgi:hypothetical protein